MKRATVVIGANYGDEGKGLIVDHLAAKITTEKVVVRFNGGAQAGHTVVTPDNKRHVFSHFGAGTLAGASTYLAKHFVCNPLLFWKEAKQLREAGFMPMVAADPRCYVTTPYDMLVNQAAEDARGSNRHGSVGVGFGETIERNLYPAFQLWKSDLLDKDKLMEKMRLIRDKWMPTRCHQLKLKPIVASDPRLSDELVDRTVAACIAFEEAVPTAGAEFLERKEVIFEGAQGLCLDMNSKNFPHVTRSNTGLTNVAPIARALSLSLEVIYVTRTYLTKHGAGPLPNECTRGELVADDTNTPHPYQGELRFAPLNVAELLSRITDDRKNAPAASVSIALTCTDQAEPSALGALRSELRDIHLWSTGPRRDAVSSISL